MKHHFIRSVNAPPDSTRGAFLRIILILGIMAKLLEMGHASPFDFGTAYFWGNGLLNAPNPNWNNVGSWMLHQSEDTTKVPGTLPDTPVAAFMPTIQSFAQTTITGGLGVSGLFFDSSLGNTEMNIIFTQAQSIGPSGGQERIINNQNTSLQTISFVKDYLIGGVTQARNDPTLTLLKFSNASTWSADGNPTICATVNIQNNGHSLNVISSGTATFYGPIEGAGDLIVGDGINPVTVISSSNALTGATRIQANGTMKLTQPNSPIYPTSGVVFSSSNSVLDLSQMTPSVSSVFYTGGITATSGGTIKIAVDGAGHSTIIDLGTTATPNLDNFSLMIVGTAVPSGTITYNLFESVASVNGTLSNGNVTLINLPNVTYALGGLVEGALQFTLTGPRSSNVANGQVIAGSGDATALSAQTSTQMVSISLSLARGEDTGSVEGQSEFTSHPLRAPDLKNDFLNATQRGIAHVTQDNAGKWSPARTEKAGIWFQPFGIVNRQVANGGSPGSKTRTGGLLAGFDYKSRYDIIWGGALGYARTSQNFDSNAGKMGVKDKFLTVFGTWFRGPWYLEGSLLAGLEKYQGIRNTGPTNNNIFVSNHHEGYQFSSHVGGGYTFEQRESKLKTYATFDYTYAAQYGYQEQGTGGSYFKQMYATMLRSEVAANLSMEYDCRGIYWKPGFTLGVVNKKPVKKGAILTSNGASFESTRATTTNISPALESTIRFGDGYSFSAVWIGEFGSQYNMQEALLKFTKKL